MSALLYCVQVLLAWLQQAKQPLTSRRSIWSALHGLWIARRSQAVNGVAGLIGNTPLVRIQSLSQLTGCEVGSLGLPAGPHMYGRAVAGRLGTRSGTLFNLLLPAACHLLTKITFWQWRGIDGMEARSGP